MRYSASEHSKMLQSITLECFSGIQSVLNRFRELHRPHYSKEGSRRARILQKQTEAFFGLFFGSNPNQRCKRTEKSSQKTFGVNWRYSTVPYQDSATFQKCGGGVFQLLLRFFHFTLYWLSIENCHTWEQC